MYSSSESFLKLLEADSDDLIKFSRKDPRLAVAVLLYRTVLADGKVRQAEIDAYQEFLDQYLEIPEDELELFERLVREKILATDDMSSMAVIVQSMPESARRDIVGMMQEIAISDDEYHETELNLVSEISRILGLS